MAEELEVVVVGAGFAGLAAGARLRADGVEPFAILERGDAVGGVWRDNTYPGAACDIPSHLYSLSFAPNPDWSRGYSEAPEIRDYLERVADDQGLRGSLRLGEELLDARWDPAASRWRLETSHGSLRARVLVSCAGPLTEPRYPDVPGMDGFRGVSLHSSRWDASVDLRGLRVGVVGTGASAVQIVPAIAPEAASVTVFQRTPPWVSPRRDREVPAWERRLLRVLPGLTRLHRALQYAMAETIVYPMIRRRPRIVEKAAREMLERQVEDPELRALLTPGYEIGCKRVLVSSDWYKALTREDVTVVPHAVSAVVPEGAVDATGAVHELDAIVYATGFQTTGASIFRRIRRADGRALADVWAGTPRLHRATTVAGFPNLFSVCGPGTGSGHGSMIWKIESQVAYVGDALAALRSSGASVFEVREDAQDRYNGWAGRELDETVWAKGGCVSWYQDAAGRPSFMWPRSMTAFRWMLRRFDVEHYTLR